MSVIARFQALLRPIVFLGRNPMTLTGAVLTTSAGVTLAVFLVLELLVGSRHARPYEGIILYGILPVIFALGLVLMPVGALWRRITLNRSGQLPTVYPTFDLAQPVIRNAALLVAVATVLNVALLGGASYKGIEHMDSVELCGLTCHTVMSPEYTAYLNSPHSRITCVQCHIGPGASFFVKSKLDGLRQVVATALNTYSRPIPSPVHTLRPARETCEQCHWPTKFHGDKVVVKTRYADDEANTPLTTVLVLRIGGQGGTGSTGIHGRHLTQRERIHYIASDERREEIAIVRYEKGDGQTIEYVAEGLNVPREQLAGREERSMDCVDCHNRPTHAFELPHRAVDRAISEGKISRELPWIKKQAVVLLQAEYADAETAQEAIADGLLEYYRANHPQVLETKRAAFDGAVAAVQECYRRNVSPPMRLTWGSHPNHIGHEDFPGCFRCHDDSHKSAAGDVISQDCSACHAILALEESDPKVLSDLGLAAPNGTN